MHTRMPRPKSQQSILTGKQNNVSFDPQSIGYSRTIWRFVFLSGLPWVWGFPWGFPWVWVWYGHGDCDESPWVLWVICGDF